MDRIYMFDNQNMWNPSYSLEHMYINQLAHLHADAGVKIEGPANQAPDVPLKIQELPYVQIKVEVGPEDQEPQERPKRLKTIKKRSTDRQSKKKQKRAQIKPERSALTNIGNQILTYLYIEKKNSKVILRMFPDISTIELAGYYSFAKVFKQCMYGYFNRQKFRKLWYNVGQKPQEILNFQIVRKLSNYYLTSLLPCAILTSKKMPAHVKPLHMSIRRRILGFLFKRDKLDDL